MSDSLPEISFSGILKVLKLVTGEEIVGLVTEQMPEKLIIKMPAQMCLYTSKDSSGNMVEYVKLSNYLASIREYEATIYTNSIVYSGNANAELEKMYQIYFLAMQSDPSSIDSTNQSGGTKAVPGLQLLNDLFNNEDFVNFVNNLIENFEGVEILSELDIDEEENESSPELIADEEEEPEPKPAKKKRSKIKPEGSRMPYKPEESPENPESWSDNPTDYI